MAINENSYEQILINTCKEVNRVLNVWKIQDVEVDYDRQFSLFRTYLSKYCKREVGWQFFSRYFRKETMTPIIKDYSLIGISLPADEKYHHNTFEEFREAVENFNFLKYIIIGEYTHELQDSNITVKSIQNIDFSNIEKITY